MIREGEFSSLYLTRSSSDRGCYQTASPFNWNKVNLSNPTDIGYFAGKFSRMITFGGNNSTATFHGSAQMPRDAELVRFLFAIFTGESIAVSQRITRRVLR